MADNTSNIPLPVDITGEQVDKYPESMQIPPPDMTPPARDVKRLVCKCKSRNTASTLPNRSKNTTKETH